MTLLDALILGLIQGLTEFLPVSSSGHLVLAEKLLGASGASLAFDVFLHLATLLAALITLKPEVEKILAYLASLVGIRLVSLRSDDLREGGRLFWALVVGTIPAAVAGLLFKDQVEMIFSSPRFVGFSLLFTGAVLLATRLAPKGRGHLDTGSALGIGMAQALALLPGVSRSGMTVAAGLFAGITRERVVRFSFLLSVPAILGASVLEMRHGLDLVAIPPLALTAGFVTALVSGFIAIQILLRAVISGKLSLFGLYCLAVGTAVLLLLPKV